MASHDQAVYGLTLVNSLDSGAITTKNLFKLLSRKTTLSDPDDVEAGSDKHLCLLLGLPDDTMERDLVMFLEPYIEEVANYALYKQYQYLGLSSKYCKFKPLMSAVVELKSKDAAESFVSVYNNLIAPSMGGGADGAAPLLALPLAWVVMNDDELFLSALRLGDFESKTHASAGEEADSSSPFAEASAGGVGQRPVALPMCGTCLSRVKGEVSGLFDGEIDSSLVSLKMSYSRRRCRTCLVGYEYLRSHQTPSSTSSLPVGAVEDKPIWRCCGSADVSNTILSHSVCGLNENIWVCLICSYTGCGRYSNRHAKEHFSQTGHGFTIELVTGRIWSYIQDNFVHVPGSLSSVYSGYSYMQESDDVNGYEQTVKEEDNVMGERSAGSENAHTRSVGSTRGGPDRTPSLGEHHLSGYVDSTQDEKDASYSPLVSPNGSEDASDNKSTGKFDRDYALAAAGAAYEGNDGGLESRNYFYNYHPDYQLHASSTNIHSGGMPYPYDSQLGDSTTTKEGSSGGKLSPRKSRDDARSPRITRARLFAAGGGEDDVSYSSTSIAAGGGKYLTPCSPDMHGAFPHEAQPLPGEAFLDSSTRSKLEHVKSEYELLKDSRLVEQDILLEKMLAQEMARALHDRYSGNNSSGTRPDGDGLNSDRYPSLEAAHRELRALTEDSASGTTRYEGESGASTSSSSSSSGAEMTSEGKTRALPSSSSSLSTPPPPSTQTLESTTHASYLNKQTEEDLAQIEACKIEISLRDQECLSLQGQMDDALHQGRAMKEANNGVISNIQALKAQERANLAEVERSRFAHEQQVAELRQTTADLRFYLRSRSTLAALPADRVSQREVQSGTVQVVQEQGREQVRSTTDGNGNGRGRGAGAPRRR